MTEVSTILSYFRASVLGVHVEPVLFGVSLVWLMDRLIQFKSKAPRNFLFLRQLPSCSQALVAAFLYLLLLIYYQFLPRTTQPVNAESTFEQTLQLFDSLDVVDKIDFMTGQWKGEGYHTGHPLDGLLEAYHWYGKRFDSKDHVFPLLFSVQQQEGQEKSTLISADVGLLGGFVGAVDSIHIPQSTYATYLARILMPLLHAPDHSTARLRMMTYRGKTTTAMLYDRLPVIDYFRKINDNTVLGIMELKGIERPFFFRLYREKTK